MTAASPAIFPVPLWYQELKWLKNQAIRKDQSFEGLVRLNQEALLELQWWSTKMNLMNGKNGYPGSRYDCRDRCIHAGMGNSLQGCPNWGPVVSGRAEKSQNYLELLAATFAVKAFTKDKQNIQVYLRMDNRTAVFYVSHMRVTRSPVICGLVIRLWQCIWCPETNLSLSAEYLPGVDNCVADRESRAIQSSAEWQLYKPDYIIPTPHATRIFEVIQ